MARTIWGRSRESLPMVLKTRSCNLLTVDNRSSPRAAMAPDVDVDVVEPDVFLLLSSSSGSKSL